MKRRKEKREAAREREKERDGDKEDSLLSFEKKRKRDSFRDHKPSAMPETKDTKMPYSKSMTARPSA